ncbi:hypothetical protein N9974_00645 [bacterium]|nr:hypothetical protein [bacterium]MDB4800444.1 hypothetical protein [bacterium]
MTIINEELAKAFMDDHVDDKADWNKAEQIDTIRDNVGLSEATEITDGAAEILFEMPDQLPFDGLRRIPIPIAKHLARISPSVDDECIPSFSNLDELDVETAEVLAEGQYYMLMFEFRKFTPHLDVFKTLSNQKGYVGYNLSALSSQLAEVLATYEGALSLPSLECISDAAAGCLAKFRGSALHLESLKQLPSPEAARSLLEVSCLDEYSREELERAVEGDGDDEEEDY